MNPGFELEDEDVVFENDDTVNAVLRSHILTELGSDKFCDALYSRIYELAHVKRVEKWKQHFGDKLESILGENIETAPYSFGYGILYVLVSCEGIKTPLCDINFRIINGKVCYVTGVNVDTMFRRLGVGQVLYDLFEDLLVSQGVNFIYGNMSQSGANFVRKRGRISFDQLDRETRMRLEKILGTGMTPNHVFDNVYFQRLQVK